ncbi:hypothetical protein KSX_90080 [Ktedonospora formicarum]|uniref:Uncharacterized protein n=1 Tax=Ktedonospora formicarum TaxID=2778364 RepID=A0A8J3MWY1_9CHLR|nr:hypothetical protein KSX_90080 [Ktedonospora formicarum]
MYAVYGTAHMKEDQKAASVKPWALRKEENVAARSALWARGKVRASYQAGSARMWRRRFCPRERMAL